jgi:putative phosphoribosyl transferase
MTVLLQNRTQAGRLLASYLKEYANRSDVIVLGLPRGGVPVAFEIAKALNLPLDICLVRKLGTPLQKELAMGAIATGGVIAINKEIVQWGKISSEAIAAVVAKEKQELERRDRLYRGNRPAPQIEGRTVILVDDGIATGSTLQAAIMALRQQKPKSIIVAVPVAHPQVCDRISTEVDKVVCPILPDRLDSISFWYQDFSQTTDEEVCKLLAQAAQEPNKVSN